MNELEMLQRIHALLQDVAADIIVTLNKAGVAWESAKVTVALLDESGIYQVEIETRVQETFSYHRASLAAHTYLRQFWDTNTLLSNPCMGLSLAIAPNGTCKTTFGYA